MLKRFCNKCNKEITSGQSYCSIKVSHIIKDPVIGEFTISDKDLELDMCEDCFNSIMEIKEADK